MAVRGVSTMIKYELSKLFHRRQTKWFLLLLFVIHILGFLPLEAPGVERYAYYAVEDVRAVYAALPEDRETAREALSLRAQALEKGLMAGVYDGALLTGSISGDSALIREVRQRVEEAASHGEYLLSVADTGQVLLGTGMYEDPDSFGARNIRKSCEVFQRLEGTEISLFYSGSIELLSGSRLPELLLGFLILLVTMEGLLREKQEGTLILIKATARGRYPLFLAKWVAMWLVVSLGVLLLYGSSLLMGVLRCGAPQWSASIQSVYGFQGCPWSMTVAEYVIAFLAMKLLWAWSILGLSVLCSTVAKAPSAYLFLFVAALLPSALLVGNWNFWGCISLIRNGDTATLLSRYENVPVFGRPVSLFTLSVSHMILLLMGSMFLGACLFVKLPPMGKKRGRALFASKKEGKPRGLLHYECKKLLIHERGLLIFLAFVLLLGYGMWQGTGYLTQEDRIYHYYSSILEGKPGDEKEDFLHSEEARFQELMEKLDAYGEERYNGNLSQESYDILSSQIMGELSKQPIFEKAKNQYHTAKERSVDYVCLTAYDKLLGKPGQQQMILGAMVMVLFLVCALSSVEAVERESNMLPLQNTTVESPRARRYKALLSGGYGGLLGMLLWTGLALETHMEYGLTGLASPGGSVELLRLSVGTVGRSLALYGLWAGAVGALCGFGIRKLSRLCGNTRHTALWAALLFELPLLLLYVLKR